MTAAELRCAGCGCEGRAATIVYDWSKPPEDARPVLKPTFGWGDPPRTVLLCGDCKAKLERRRKRRKGRP